MRAIPSSCAGSPICPGGARTARRLRAATRIDPRRIHPRRRTADRLGSRRRPPAMIRRLLALALAAPAGCTSVAPPHAAVKTAMAYSEAGRYAEAAREIELAVRANPEDVALRRQAAELQAEAGDLARAVDHLEIAIRLAPSDP